MKFHKVQIKNFLSFSDTTFVLDKQGLVLVLGDNQGTASADSNGAGKSSLLDAFCWSLWGNTVKGLKDDEVVNWRADKECEVTTFFSDAGNTYEVTRYRKCKDKSPHNGLTLLINGEAATQASVAATQERITTILDLDFNTFQCMMPGASIKLAQLTDKGIKETLESLLQLEVFSEAQSVAKDRLKAVTGKIVSVEARTNSLKLSIQNYTTKELELANKIYDFSAAKSEKIKHCAKEMSDARFALRNAPALTSIKALSKLKEGYQLQYVTYTAEYDSIACKLGDKKDSFLVKLQAIKDSVVVARSEKKRLVEKLEKLPYMEATCTKCKQGVPDSHKSKLSKEYTAQIAVATDTLATYSRSYNDLLNDMQTECSATPLTLVQTKLTKLSEELQSVDQQLHDHESASMLRAALEAALDVATAKVEAAKAEECALQPYLDEVVVDHAKASEELSTLTQQLTNLTKQQEQLQFWVDSFGANGLRPHLLRHVTPLLNRKVQKYANIATKGDMKIEFETEKTYKNGKTKSVFSVKVQHKDGGNTYKSSSSGEKAKADVCIALALGDLAAARSSKSVNFRFMDEPFENIDNTGLAGIVALLTQQSNNFDSIFCVTHNQSLKEYFPVNLTVTKHNGIAKIVK